MKHSIILSYFLFSTTLTPMAIAGTYNPADLTGAYSYLNQLRLRAGLTELRPNSLLETAALNHANYLANNNWRGHEENQGTPGFTGASPKDRTSYAGYRSLSVSENVSSGNYSSPGYQESIDGLMSAIYHRLGFLDLVNNEVGIGIAQNTQVTPAYNAYVYNMGNADYNALCTRPPAFSGNGRYYYGICVPEANIEGTAFDQATILTQGNNPKILQWPTDNDNDTPPAFFEEDPDPLPDYSVSGYPISIQFNPLSYQSVQMVSFKLYRDRDNTEIQPTRLLTKQTDPNAKLTDLQFVLFPLSRLDWDTAYRVEAAYTSATGPETLSWQFKTRSLSVPIFTIAGQGETLRVPLNSNFAVYLPPSNLATKIGAYHWTYSQGMTIDSQFKDGNTLLISVAGSAGQTAKFDAAAGQFTVTLDAAATLPTTSLDTAPTKNLLSNFDEIAPVAQMSLSSTYGTAPFTVTAEAANSYDEDGYLVSYDWSTSDGQIAAGPTASFTFTNGGTYTITLMVTDNSGLTAISEEMVSVDSTSPVVGYSNNPVLLQPFVGSDWALEIQFPDERFTAYYTFNQVIQTMEDGTVGLAAMDNFGEIWTLLYDEAWQDYVLTMSTWEGDLLFYFFTCNTTVCDSVSGEYIKQYSDGQVTSSAPVTGQLITGEEYPTEEDYPIDEEYPVEEVFSDKPSLDYAVAFDAQGNPFTTETMFAGGISVNGGDYQTDVEQTLNDRVDITGQIKVDSNHVGQVADIFVIAETTLPFTDDVLYFMLDEGLRAILLWDENPANLAAFIPNVVLQSIQTVPMYQGYFIYPGTLKVQFGYRLQNGTVVMNEQGIAINIRE